MPDSTPRIAEDTSLTLERRYKVAPQRVWEAWTQAATLSRWFGLEGCAVVNAELDVQVGGRYQIEIRTIEGPVAIVSGVYREVRPYEKLVFTWAWSSTPELESLVSVTLRPSDTGTQLTLTHARFSNRTACEQHTQGWTGSLVKLATLLNPPASQ